MGVHKALSTLPGPEVLGDVKSGTKQVICPVTRGWCRWEVSQELRKENGHCGLDKCERSCGGGRIGAKLGMKSRL